MLSVFLVVKAKVGVRFFYGGLKLFLVFCLDDSSAQLFLEEINQRGEVRLKDNPVNRLESQAFVVNVHDFNKGKADRAFLNFFRRGAAFLQALFFLFPNGLGRGKRMVSVSHREQKCGAVFASGLVKFLERGFDAF